MVRKVTFLVVLVLTVLFSCSPKYPTVDRPNILFIFTDDQSHRTVSSYEASLPFASTPHIDRLASEGIRFTDAYVGAWCQPARAKIMTGKLLHGISGIEISKYPETKIDTTK